MAKGLVENCYDVLEWIEEIGYPHPHPMYAKMKMIKTTLEAHESSFTGGKDS